MQTNHLITLAESLASHLSKSEATISNRVTTHARLFERLRDGKGCNVTTYNTVMERFADIWPADLAWPSDVPRPRRRNRGA